MLHDMLDWDLGTWHPEAARPDTAALSRQKAANLPPVEAAWLGILQEGRFPVALAEADGDFFRVSTEQLRDYVREQSRRDKTSNQSVAELFKRLGYEKFRSSPTGGLRRGYVVPPLVQARADWDAKFFPWEWDDEEAWEGDPC
jgi:hypothetical protein